MFRIYTFWLKLFKHSSSINRDVTNFHRDLCDKIYRKNTFNLNSNYNCLNICFFLKIGKLFFLSVQQSYNPTFFFNSSLTVYNDSNGFSKANLTFNIKADLFNVSLFCSLNGKKPNEDEYKLTWLKGNVNACDWEDGPIGKFAYKLVGSTLPKYSNYKTECPIPKGQTYVREFPIPDVSLFPAFMIFNGEIFWEVSTEAKTKLKDSKRMTTLFNIKIYGVSKV